MPYRGDPVLRRGFWAALVLLLSFCGTAPNTLAQEDEMMPDGFPRQFYAPYVYMAAYPSYLLARTAEETGVRYFTLAFILDGGGSCRATWGGSQPLERNTILPGDLQKLRDLGGEVIVSFGGAGGNEMGLVCPDVDSLVTQYQRVIDTYGVTFLDFDIEGDEMDDRASIDRRSQALTALQATQQVSVGFTLPVLPTGLTAKGLAVLQSAIDHGTDISVVNIMTMNFGDAYAPNEMGQNTVAAATSLFKQLQALYPERSEEDVWAMIALTPMIGANDTAPAIFTLADAEMVTTFAQEKGIRYVSMWAYDRDKPCISDSPIAVLNCSGTPQEPRAFSAIFNRLTAGDR